MAVFDSTACSCGRVHGNVAPLRKQGWQRLTNGNAVLLVACDACGAMLTAATAPDASVCDSCHRLVLGTSDDLKVCVGDDDKGLVLCTGCARRDSRCSRWLEWRGGLGRKRLPPRHPTAGHR